MSCLITSGRKLPCTKFQGGVKNVYFANYETLDTKENATIAAGELTDFGAGASGTPLFKYEVKGTTSLDTAITKSVENGSLFYESTIQLELVGLDNVTQEEIKLISSGRPHVIIETYNGESWIAGLEHGAEVTAGNIQTGAAMGDKTGFSLTILAQEKEPPFLINKSVYSTLVDTTQIEL